VKRTFYSTVLRPYAAFFRLLFRSLSPVAIEGGGRLLAANWWYNLYAQL